MWKERRREGEKEGRREGKKEKRFQKELILMFGGFLLRVTLNEVSMNMRKV
jgi:hypothetical protein